MIDFEEEQKGDSRFEQCFKICEDLLKPGKTNLLEIILKSDNQIGKKPKEFAKSLFDRSIGKTLHY